MPEKCKASLGRPSPACGQPSLRRRAAGWTEGAQEDRVGKEVQMEETPSPMTTNPLSKQHGEIRTPWAWTEPSVWMDRMLTALEKGVKGDV